MAEQKLIPTEELIKYADSVMAAITRAVNSRESKNFVVSSGDDGVELDYLLAGHLWSYPKRLFALLPPFDYSVLSPNPTYQQIGSHWGRKAYLTFLQERLGVQAKQRKYLDKVEARNLDSIHFY